MNLRIVFRIGAIVFLINALGLLFSTATFFEMANLTMSPSLLTVGQFMGVTFLILRYCIGEHQTLQAKESHHLDSYFLFFTACGF